MKIGKILAVAAVATVFASCSNEEELANVGKSESNAIRFAGISGLSDTRTTPIGTTNLTSTNFDVMAFMSADNALFMGGKHEAGHSDHGVKIVYNTGWNYEDKSQQAYWPTTGDVDFYAVSPAFTDELVYYSFAYDMTSDAKTITYATPDVGGAKRANSYAKYLNVPLVLCHKQRAKANVVENMTVIGEVEDKDVIIIDDMVDTAGTITKAANLMKEKGAKSVRALASHAIMSDPASERVDECALTEIIFSNSIPYKGNSKKVTTLSIAPLFADTIRRVHKYESISSQYLIK